MDRAEAPVAIDGETRLAVVLGHPIAHSLSPAMHNAAFRAAGVNAVYCAFDVPPARLGAAVAGLRALGFLGANVTAPHKEAVADLVDGLESEARDAAAVNTLYWRESALWGANTDGAGFLLALRGRAGLDPAGKTAVVLGAGGAARGVGLALARGGASGLVFLNRTPDRATRLAEAVGRLAPGCRVEAGGLSPEAAGRARGAELVINATPAGPGGGPDEARFWKVVESLMGPGTLVADLVYRPVETPFLALARRRGARALPGYWMLLYQGALAFERWLGRPAPVGAMIAALVASLEGGAHPP